MPDMSITAIDSIVSLLADYRRGEIAPIDGAHVYRWLTQFPQASQAKLLHAMASTLPRIYISHGMARSFCEKLLNSKEIWGEEPTTAIFRSRFLNLQCVGHSQQAMLQLCDEVLQKQAGFSTTDCLGTERRYIYLDDVCLSGRTLIQNMKIWLKNSARPGSEVIICFMATTREGLSHARRELHEFATAKKITIRYRIAFTINEGLANQSPLLLDEERIMLTELFSAAGRKILSDVTTSDWLYPLGFQATAETWTHRLYFSWRNIPNNCPPALWWGRPDWPNSKLANWTPLIPRNVERKEITNEPIAA